MTSRIQNAWYLSRLAGRVRERRFWLVQAGLLTVTLLHTLTEATGTLEKVGGSESLMHVPVTLYLVPIVYAGLHYGREGAVLTAAAAGGLSVTNIVVWHRHGFEWLGETIFLITVVALGLLVAVLAESQSLERTRAESSSRRLQFVTSVSGMLSRAPGVERALAMVLSVMREVMELETAEVLDSNAGRPALGEVDAPIMVDSQVIGTLRVRFRERASSEEERELLRAIAAQMATAMETDRLRLMEDERLRTYAQRVTDAQEEERRRIARDLHDDIAQSLIVLCRALERLPASTAEGRGFPLPDVLGQAQAVLRDVRRFGRELRPQLLDDLGLVPALEALMKELTEKTGIQGRVRAEGPISDLPPSVSLTLFRVAQEALKNVEKHSSSPWSHIAIHSRLDRVKMIVADGGKGFRVQDGTGASGEQWGLLGMQERVKLLGGTFTVSTQPGRGTELITELPIAEDSQALSMDLHSAVHI